MQPIIEATSERTLRSMSVAVLDQNDVLVIARALVRRSLSSGLAVGSRLPAYCSAHGRALLSDRPDADILRLLKQTTMRRLTVYTKTGGTDVLNEIKAVRSRGYATNDQEVEIGVQTIAVPLRSRSGRIEASLSMSAPPGGSDLKNLIKFLPELDAARSRIEAML